tara:strand:- start:831 stop:1142 length:312 start_codon:yes stop_codon:yes gene_type:complete
MDRGYSDKDREMAMRDKARFLIDRIDNVEDRPNVYRKSQFTNPNEIISNPANRGMDSKDARLNLLNTERYRKANSRFFDTPVLPLNMGHTSKYYFNQERMFFK